MKEKRQRAMLDIIANHIIETQEQLLAELKERGFRCTQATISRDMKELQLIKELTLSLIHISWMTSSATSSRPVFRADVSTVSGSSGASWLSLTTSTEMPSASNASAAASTSPVMVP